MSTLVDHQIRRLGSELVEPFYHEKVQPASIDLTLGTRFRVFVPHGEGVIDLHNVKDITRLVDVGNGGRFVLHPGEFVLAHTAESVKLPSDLVARIEGKSSLGRLGLVVHATAGFIDPGWEGPLTLEMSNMLRLPLVLYPGDDICQVSFMQTLAPASKPYSGRYVNSTGVEASRYGASIEGPAPAILGRPWHATLHELGEIETDGECRLDPRTGNGFVKIAHNDNLGIVTVTDIFGGHEHGVDIDEWERWEKVKRDG